MAGEPTLPCTPTNAPPPPPSIMGMLAAAVTGERTLKACSDACA